MTLLTICQNIATEAGYPAPTTIIGNTSIIAKRLLIAANKAGKTVAKGLVPGGLGQHDWQALRKEQTFDTIEDQQGYVLKGAGSIVDDADFVKFIDDTLWDRTNNNPVNIYNPQEWQLAKSGLVDPISPYYNAIKRGDSLLLDPTPSAEDTLAFEYLSNKWCESSGGTAKVAFTVDTDVGILDEDLIEYDALWRFLKAMGKAYAEEKVDAETSIKTAISNDEPRSIIRAAFPADVYPIVNVPQTIPIPS